MIGKPHYYECGICGHLHPWSFNGDCRDDANRFTFEQLDATHGKPVFTEAWHMHLEDRQGGGYVVSTMDERVVADMEGHS